MLTRTVALLAAALTLSATGCGADDGDAAPSAPRTAANGDVFNDADVAFATEMIPHHAEALQMVVLTQGRTLDPAAQRLAEGIRETQVPEVESMTDLLTGWDQQVPETSLDHANAGHDDDGMDHSDTGEMADLAAASDAEFEDLWLTMMVEHHRGAVELAEAEVGEGENAAAVALAELIASSQESEIGEMEDLLAS